MLIGVLAGLLVVVGVGTLTVLGRRGPAAGSPDPSRTAASPARGRSAWTQFGSDY